MSRKPSTFSGCVMPETSRPAPNISPQPKQAMMSSIALPSEAVTDDRHRDDGRTHEDGSRRNRACRKPREAAYPVARRAAIAHAAAKAAKQAGGRNYPVIVSIRVHC